MSARTAVKGLVVVALAAPLVGGLVGASPAEASGSISSPASGTTYHKSATVVNIRAKVLTKADLTLSAPGGKPVVVSSTGSQVPVGGKLSYDLNTACWKSSSATCVGSSPAPNGAWTITVTGTGSGGGSQQFTLAIPPGTPTGFRAHGSGSRQVVFTWTKGAEPDLTSYRLYDGAGNVLRATIPAGDACHGPSCSYAMTYPTDAPGRHDFALAAYRRTSPADPGTLPSLKAAASAVLAAPTRSGPIAAGASGRGPSTPSTPGGPSGSGTAGAGTVLPAGDNGAGRALGQSLSALAPDLALAQLPGLAQTAAPLLAEAPLPLGTYTSELPYKPVAQDPVTTAPVVHRAVNAVPTGLDTRQLPRSLAGALVLLLVAAHLRRLVSSPSDE